MAVVVGTDEAGYGPNLGPLVITATVWDAAAALPLDPGPWAPQRFAAGSGGGTLPLFGDSKRLFARGGGLAALERGVWAALAVVDPVFLHGSTWRALVAWLDPDRPARLDQVPWYAGYDRAVPAELSPGAIAQTAAMCAAECERAAYRLCGLRARIVSEPEFNAGVAKYGNKATALSHWTLELVGAVFATIQDTIQDTEICLWSDKHGGRNHYAALLQHQLTSDWVHVREETRPRSVYAWHEGARRFEAHFLARGEQLLPVALASMISKYLRELAMEALNNYWLAHVPGLRPTAGYPADARRFLAQIRAAQQRLGIAAPMLWRLR
ncbi:MAG: hypothetical protein MUF48_04305 [Pirellulaceae bacterium]|nr:hypothetical protein [Pirellulaceae bacterium]